MRLTMIFVTILVLLCFATYGCFCNCPEDTTSDVEGDPKIPPEKNTVDSCKAGQSIECAGGGKRDCDCSGSYCLWSACKT